MKKFLIFDIDHTIATFDHDAGMKNLTEYMRGKVDSGLAGRICAFMDRCYAAFHARAKGIRTADLEKIERIIEDTAKETVEGVKQFSDVHWSRELWIYIAAAGSLSPATAVEAAGYFWQGIALSAFVYDDARKFFSWLYRWPDGYNYQQTPEDRWEMVFVTSSDARLKESHDNTKLVYDPDYSIQEKFRRVSRVLPRRSNRLGFGFPTFIGDPVSKPHPEFWQKVITNTGYNQGEDLAIMIGDSPRSDLTGLDKFGIIPVLIDRENSFTPPEVPHVKYVISSLEALKNIVGIERLNKKEELERRK